MRELTTEDREKLDALHLQVRHERAFKRQVNLVSRIAEIIGYPKVNPRGKWAKQLVGFICAGTEKESTYAGSLAKKAADQVRTETESDLKQTPGPRHSNSGVKISAIQ